MIQPDHWPDPLGFITTEEPRWVEPQHGWKYHPEHRSFSGRVRGKIPEPGGDRCPDLPDDAFALKRVSLIHPEREAKYHFPKRKIPFERPDGSWVAQIKYLQAPTRYGPKVWLFSTETEESPLYQKWKGGSGWDERRWVEYFDSRAAAIGFVEEETGLHVPEP